MKKVKSAYRTLELIEMLSKSPEGLTLTEIKDYMGIAKSTAHELLQTLLMTTYIFFDAATKKYNLGAEILALGARYLKQAPDVQRAESLANRLYQKFGVTVRIGVLSGEQLVVIKEYGGMGDALTSIKKWTTLDLPLHASSFGTALLCRLHPIKQKEIWQNFKNEISWDVFYFKLKEAVSFGMTFEPVDLNHSVYSIAIPIVEGNGDTAAAVELCFDRSNMEYALFKEMLLQVFAEASEFNGEPAWVSEGSHQQRLIYFSLPNLSTQKSVEYLHTFEAGSKSWLYTNCQDDVLKQQLLLELMLHYRKPACAVICPVDAARSDEIFRLCARHKVPTICFMRPSRSRFVEYYVGGDAFEQGVMQMTYASNRTKGKGRIVILEGDPYNDNARNMVLGYHHVLREYPDMVLVDSISVVNWSKAEARDIVGELIGKETKIDVVVAGNDTIAEGAIEKLKQNKLTGKVFVVGGDGDPSAVRLIKAREQHATVFQHPAKAVEAVLQVASALIDGKQLDEWMERKSITKDYPGKEILVYTISYSFIDSGDVNELERYWKQRSFQRGG